MDRGNHTDDAIPEYVVWHSKRAPVLDPNYPLVEAPEDKLERLKIENQRFRQGAQLVELSQKCQQLEIQNRQLHDQLGNSQIEIQGWVQDWVRESANNVKLKGQVKEWREEATEMSRLAARIEIFNQEHSQSWRIAQKQCFRVQEGKSDVEKAKIELKRELAEQKCIVGWLVRRNNELEQQVHDIANRLTISENQNVEMRAQLEQFRRQA